MDPTAIRDQIGRVLRSQNFANKGQLRKLLEILFQNMDSQSSLKPDQIIKELWPEETRTKRSADVATEMNRLRRSLDAYYEGEGKNDPLRISLPNRSVSAADGTQEKRWIIANPRGTVKENLLHAQDNPRRNLKRIVEIAALGIALLVASFVFFRNLAVHDRPWSGRLDGATLSVLNEEGKPLWSKSFPDGFWPEYYGQGVAQRIRFDELEGDGRTNVLFLYHPAVGPRSHSTTLICYTDQGKEKWRWTPGKNLPELEGSPATFRTLGLAVLKPREKQSSRIVVSSYHDPSYPHQIAILDPNGKKLSEYWHSGHLDHLTLADIQGDGQEEIVATGISNGYRQATLVVLDPNQVFGASAEAARPEIQLRGMGAAAEKMRLLFPRSDLNQALSVYNMGEEATVDHGRIRFSVRECLQLSGCLIWYEFDKYFRLQSAMADDQFRSAHAEFYLKSKNPHSFTAGEEAAFQKIRCLVGCTTVFLPSEIR